MQINKVFIRLINGKEEKLRNPDELSKLVKYCQSVCWDYKLIVKINGRTVKVKMAYGKQ